MKYLHVYNYGGERGGIYVLMHPTPNIQTIPPMLQSSAYIPVLITSDALHRMMD